MYCDLCSQYIKVRKIFNEGNYSRAETIRGITVGSKSSKSEILQSTYHMNLCRISAYENLVLCDYILHVCKFEFEGF